MHCCSGLGLGGFHHPSKCLQGLSGQVLSGLGPQTQDLTGQFFLVNLSSWASTGYSRSLNSNVLSGLDLLDPQVLHKPQDLSGPRQRRIRDQAVSVLSVLILRSCALDIFTVSLLAAVCLYPAYPPKAKPLPFTAHVLQPDVKKQIDQVLRDRHGVKGAWQLRYINDCEEGWYPLVLPSVGK